MVNPTKNWDRIPVFGFYFKGDDVTPSVGSIKFTMTSRVSRVDGRRIYAEGETVTRTIGDTVSDAAIRDAVRDSWRAADQAVAGASFDSAAWNSWWNTMLTGAVFASFPASDDPDIVETGYQVMVTESLTSGTGKVYPIQPQLSDLAAAPRGINLGTVAVPPGSPAAPAPIYAKGKPGGVAALDGDGFLLDGAGNRVASGSGGVVSASIVAIQKMNAAQYALIATPDPNTLYVVTD